MATVIRSARMSDEPVTLILRKPAEVTGRTLFHPEKKLQGIVNENAVMHDETVVEPKEDSLSKDKQALLQQETELAELKAMLLEKTRQIEERERSLQEALDSERKAVREQAYAEGYKSGQEEAAKQYQTQLDGLANLIDSSRKEFANEIAGLEDVIVGIAFEAVCKIIGKSMVEQDGVLAVVREVISHVKEHEKLVMRVAPQDYEILFQNADLLFGERQEGRPEIIPDDRVAMGGCLIETSGGSLDGRLELQLQLLRDTLSSARRMLPE